jgi:hypothetical protein
MSGFKLIFLGLLVLSAVNAEFLFEKNVAADDKFMCLHKKLYRNEKPIAKANPARILSLKRVLQVDTDSSKNALASYLNLQGTLLFQPTTDFCNNVATALQAEHGAYFTSDEFKSLVKDSINAVWTSKNQPSVKELWDNYSKNIQAEVTLRINNLLGYIGKSRVQDALDKGLSKIRLIYIMLNIRSLFIEDHAAALKAYDDYFAANIDKVRASTSTAVNAQVIIFWIEAIKKRFIENKIVPDPDSEKILEPFVAGGDLPSETPSGSFMEPVPQISTPTPVDFEETEPAAPITPKSNEDILIKDMIIEIQRTWNVEKMILTYNQLTSSMKIDIDSCGLNLKPALARCEQFNGVGNCEPVSTTMVAPKCPVGYSREGCCRCVADCAVEGLSSINRSFCQITNAFYFTPSYTSGYSGAVQVEGAKFSAGACPSGFSMNKFICYRVCPVGTVSIGGGYCLKNKAISLGAPYQWTAGDE